MIKQHRSGTRLQSYHVRPVRYTVSAGSPEGDSWAARMVGICMVAFGGLLLYVGPIDQVFDGRGDITWQSVVGPLPFIVTGLGLVWDRTWAYLAGLAIGLMMIPVLPIGTIVGAGLLAILGSSLGARLKRSPKSPS